MGRVPGSGSRALAGAGVDAERVERFTRFLHERPGLIRVWTRREVEHARSLDRPALGLAASFCCKEALLKALGGRYPFAACELLLDPRRGPQALTVVPSVLQARGLGAAVATLDYAHLEDRGELLAVVTTHPAAPDGGDLEPGVPLARAVRSIPVAEVAAARDAVAAERLSEGEIAGIARRPAQTLAGFVALKLALADLWAQAFPGPAARPADFLLAHRPSGAPYLAAAPPLPRGLAVAVSVSHTAAFAYGLAVLGPAVS